MKVCTDACLFGAWVAKKIRHAGRVLDIGTGTGLLSLMYAQENPKALIDAIEIDPPAAEQTAQNSRASSWSSRITIHNVAIQQFKPDHTYDLIIANPPFFENDLHSSNTGRNNAMHDTSLTLEELSGIIPQHLSPEGQFAVLLPYHRNDHFITLMNNRQMHPGSRLLVRQSPAHAHFRSILCFAQQPGSAMQEEELTIKEGDGYSKEFISLLKEYYLYL